MIADVNNIFILLVFVGVYSYQHEKKSEVTKDGSFLMAEVLQSLLKLNEARYKTLKKLNYLNTGYNLRTSTENSYDFSSLLKKLKKIFNSLSVKPSLKKHDDNVELFDVFYDNKYILTIPLPSKNDQNVRKRTNENVLRAQSEEATSHEDNDNYKNNDNDNLSSDDNDVIKNKTLRDDVEDEDYTCGRGRLRCYFACKEAYRTSCYTRPCDYSFRKQMRRSCNDECEDRFFET